MDYLGVRGRFVESLWNVPDFAVLGTYKSKRQHFCRLRYSFNTWLTSWHMVAPTMEESALRCGTPFEHC